jgi:hypothetical protein
VPIDQRTVNAVRIRDSQVVEWVWSLPDRQAAVDHVQRHTDEFSRSQMNATPRASLKLALGFDNKTVRAL